ncbi:MAG: hypothetical protein J6R67_03520 [Treponema sp.]|nr:hypothetical protein [Treponema sp.]
MKRNKKLIFFAMILLASFISLALIGCPADAELPLPQTLYNGGKIDM